MRDMSLVVRRLFDTHRTVRTLQVEKGAAPDAFGDAQEARLLVYSAALHILCWVLQVDRGALDIPATATGLRRGLMAAAIAEQPRELRGADGRPRVAVHHLEMEPGRGMLLVEIPRHEDADPGYATEDWGFFLSRTHAMDLHRALGQALYTAAGESADPEAALAADGAIWRTPPVTRLSALGGVPGGVRGARSRPRLRLPDPAAPDIEGGYNGLGQAMAAPLPRRFYGDNDNGDNDDNGADGPLAPVGPRGPRGA